MITFLAKYLDTGSNAYSLLFNSPIRPIANSIHKAIVYIQIKLLSGTRNFKPDNLNSLLTIIIKTYERPHIAQRLIKSIRRKYPNIKIIVVDDSKKPQQFSGAETIHIPFDSGVGSGRNAALAQVKTPLFLNLDDDFVFYKNTDLGSAVERMLQYDKIDIMGGWLINLPFFRLSGPGGYIVPQTPARVTFPEKEVGPFKVYQKVPQFYIGVTSRVALVKWDTGIKCLDHGAFFGRAAGVLRVVFNEDLKILHARTPFDLRYSKRRNNLEEDLKLLAIRYIHP